MIVAASAPKEGIGALSPACGYADVRATCGLGELLYWMSGLLNVAFSFDAPCFFEVKVIG